MKTLLLLRHAKSSWAEPGMPDHDRPLNERGKRAAPRVGQLVKAHGLRPDLILSSTARRARKTAEKVAHHCGYAGEIELSPALYQAQPADCLRSLQEVSDEHRCVLLVGHNPTLEELLAQLTGQPESLPTAALAVVEFPIDTWQELAAAPSGQLVHLWRPKETP
jgi:phosphohistidine phosphatase